MIVWIIKCLNNEPEVQNIQAATWVYVAHSIVHHTQMLELGPKLYLGVILVNPILKNTQSSENVWRWIN